MTPTEKSSLRIALLVSLSFYAVLFVALALLLPGTPPRSGAPDGRRALLVELSNAAEGRTSGPPAAAAAAVRQPRMRTTPVGTRLDGTTRAPAQGPLGSKEAVTLQRAVARSPGPAGARSSAAVNGNGTSSAGEKERRASAPAGGGAAKKASASGAAVSPGGIQAESPPARVASMAATDGRNAPGRRESAAGTAGSFPQAKASGAGGPAGAGSLNARPVSVAAVLATIRGRVVRDRTYPPAAARRGIEGRVTVAATVGADGRLLHVRLVRSSGSTILDSAGIKLLERVFPVDNPLAHGFTVEIPIVYRLDPPG